MDFNIYKCKDSKECRKIFKEMDDNKKQLIQIFSSGKLKTNQKIINYANRYLPQSNLIGTTTAKAISNDGDQVQIVIAVIKFNNSFISSFSFDNDLNFKLDQYQNNEAKLLLVFAATGDFSGTQIASVLNKRNSGIKLAGGYASSMQGPAYVFNNEGIFKSSSTAVLLSGQDLNVDLRYNFGWESISRQMEITKKEGRVVYELDGRNILQVYQEFLGGEIDDQLVNSEIIKFPLLVEDEINLARFANKKIDNGLEFLAELNEGDLVKISYANLNKIVKNISNLYTNLQFKPEAALIYSSRGRNQYFNSLDFEVEEGLADLDNKKAGFYTAGEFATVNNRHYNLNLSSTVLYLSEAKTRTKTSLTEENLFEAQPEHLFHLSKKIISDSEIINQKMRRVNKKTEAKNFNETASIIFKELFQNKDYTGAIITEDKKKNLKIYLEDQINLKVYRHLEKLWDHKRNEIIIKKDILGFKKMFIIYLNKEIELQLIILSSEIDLFEIKENELFINQIPNYLKKSMLYEELEQNIASLSTLEKTSNFLYSTLELKPLYDRIIDIIVGTMGMESALILREKDSVLKTVSVRNIEQNSDLSKYFKNKFKSIIEKNKIVIKDDFKIKDLYNSFVAIPIIFNNYKAVLFAIQSKYKNFIDESQQKFIRTLSNQIKVSIKNALNHTKLRKLSVTDGLTNLYNHRYFHNNIKEDDNNYSIAILDIDDFKNVNDNYGHQAGDEILRSLSDLLKTEIRGNDLVARYGGEEFIIYFDVNSRDILKKLLKRLLEKIRKMRVKFDGTEFQITVSIGAAINNNQESNQKIIKKADTALYIAKGAGKNTIKLYQE